MKVIALRHDEVLRYAGSYDSSPPSPSVALIWTRSVARIAPSTIGSEYSRPVRLSTIVRESDGNAASLVERHDDWNLPGSPPRQPHHASMRWRRAPAGERCSPRGCSR